MAPRSLRMYGKKRGHRRTGSKTLGNVGEALVLAFFLALGTGFTIALLKMPILPEWRVNHDFVETTGVVTDLYVGQRSEGDGPGYRAEVRVRYNAGGQPHEAWTYDITYDTSWAYSSDRASRQALIDQFERGQTCPCWYDPQDPDTVVVVRGYSGWLWSLLVVPAAFVVIGGGGLVYTLLQWGKTPEHLAATSQLAARLELLDESAATAKDFPNVPRDANLTNSPGTRLKYRLPINAGDGWKLATAALVALVWNGIVAALIVIAVRQALTEQSFIWLLLFIVPFLAGGIALVWFVVRRVLIATGVGTTQLEISNHPLLPGRRYDLWLSQAGRTTMKSLRVDLVCEESATFLQGTDTRTHTRRVFEQPIFERQGFDIPPGLSFEQQCRIEVPPHAMHSFQADHNAVQWKFVVRGEAGDWPVFERSFPIVVYPQPAAVRRNQGTTAK